MRTLKEVINDARARHVAIGHFNVSNFEQFKGVMLAVSETKIPAIIGVSEGEREYLGVKQIADLVRSVRDEYGLEIYLNADHTHTLSGVREAVLAGFDAVLFDAGRLAFEDNLKKTAEAVALVKDLDSRVIIEGEIGYLGGGSELLSQLPSDVSLSADSLTSISDAVRFIEETHVDLLAPAVGTIHGMLKDAPHPRLDIQRIQALSQVISVPLVLHGGSGTSALDFREAIQAGVSLIHISTELRLLWRQSLENVFVRDAAQINPGRVGVEVSRVLAEHIARRMKFFQT